MHSREPRAAPGIDPAGTTTGLRASAASFEGRFGIPSRLRDGCPSRPPQDDGSQASQSRSRDALASELCQSHERFASTKTKGGGAPEGAMSWSRTVRRRGSALCASALACRRPTAALAKAVTPRLNPGPRFLELPGANGRTLPGASAASTSQAGRSAGRVDARSRPGAKLRASPAGTALAPSVGCHRLTPLPGRAFAM
jgi:hypothetical protein